MLRSLVFLAVAMLAPLAASAQQPAAQPPIAPPATTPPAATAADAAAIRVCSRTALEEANEKDIDFIKSCQEAFKLKAENDQLKQEAQKLQEETLSLRQRNQNGFLDVMLAFGPLLGALIALVPLALGYMWKSNSEKRLIEVQNAHARAGRREEYTLRLMSELSDKDPARQSFATAGLVSMVRENLDTSKTHVAHETDRMREAMTIIAALFARLRDETMEIPEAKYIADELGKIFAGLPKKNPPFQIKDFNLQLIHMDKAYWADVNCTYADFFEANLSEVSLRRAILKGTIFRKTVLAKVVFADADLENADLRGAHLGGAQLDKAKNLPSAKFSKETVYDADTTWPPGFDPRGAGLTEVPVEASA
ncbi:MAG TPA: pentapeptide repeat-containing protein [Hyphomonadaceae bacterium]|jgi:hypothetical protein|nr:pentapeptide repeat-containing protein [Hyphomonadaceae bacterium]